MKADNGVIWRFDPTTNTATASTLKEGKPGADGEPRPIIQTTASRPAAAARQEVSVGLLSVPDSHRPYLAGG